MLALPLLASLVLAPSADPVVSVPPAMVITVPDLSGSWKGSWCSQTSGHKGPLQATFRKVSEQCYRVTFQGRFWKVVPFRYAITMRVAGIDETGALVLTGEQVLGPILGTFRYTATATAGQFTAQYTSKRDCGYFMLSRCCP